MKILFVVQNFQMGGIQMAFLNLLKELSKQEQYQIEVFSFGKGALMDELPVNIRLFKGNLLLQLISTPFREVRKGKNIYHLFLRILCMLLVRLVGTNKFYNWLLRKNRINDKYTIAVSYFNDVVDGYFNRGTNLFVDKYTDAEKKYAWIHTDPLKAGFNVELTKKAYANFDKLLCVSEACRKNLCELLPEYRSKIKVVYNSFPINEIKEKSIKYIPTKKNGINILSIGRMDNATKRFDLIPQICKLLKTNSITNFHWRVIGDGPDFENNIKLVTQLKVNDLVEFLGEYKNPYPLLRESDLFVLTSAYEGYPMVIGEALILQTPVITTNFAAAKEQIANGINGIITEANVERLFFEIKNLLLQPERIIEMKKNIYENPYTNRKANEQLALEFDIGD